LPTNTGCPCRGTLHQDDRRRRRKHVRTTLADYWIHATGRAHGVAIPRYFLGRTLSFESNEHPTVAEQGTGPTPQSRQWSDGTRHYYIGSSELLLDGWFLSPATNHRDGEPERLDGLGQPCHPARHRLEESHPQIGSRQREGNTRQAGTRAKVHDDRVRRH